MASATAPTLLATPLSPADAFTAALNDFFALLERLDFAAAAHAATRLPCVKQLSSALYHFCTCEANYFSMARLSQSATLERALERTAREL